jgi:hypothetical protein
MCKALSAKAMHIFETVYGHKTWRGGVCAECDGARLSATGEGGNFSGARRVVQAGGQNFTQPARAGGTPEVAGTSGRGVARTVSVGAGNPRLFDRFDPVRLGPCRIASGL